MRKDYEKEAGWQISRMDQVYSFDGKTVLDIGCGNGRMVQMIAECYQPEFVTGIDLKLRVPEEKTAKYELKGEVSSDALPFEDNTFDFVYSISTFEHIGNITGTLSEIRRVLKPMGKFYTSFCPIWTSVAGHHVYCARHLIREDCDHDEEVVGAVPPWGHLYMSEEEMYEHLQSTELSEFQRKAIVEYVYRSDNINRHTASRTRMDLMLSGMIVRKYCETVTFSRQWALDRKGPSELTEEIIDRIAKTAYSLQDIGIVRMEAELEKYQSL